MNYYGLPYVSNSDLTALKQYFFPEHLFYDPEIAYRFGNLFDYMVTEPHKVNFFKRTIEGYEEPFTLEAFEIAAKMKNALKKDPMFAKLAPFCDYQRIFIEQVAFEYAQFKFNLMARCKYDFFMNSLNWGGDLKSTTATTQKQFVDACYHFDYDRSRVFYMLLSGAKKDLIIGVSKKNYGVFKIPIEIGDAFYKSGLEKLNELAFKWWYLFEN